MEILHFASARGYRVLALPHFVEVLSRVDLTLQMTLTETFLLAPWEPPVLSREVRDQAASKPA